MCSDAEKRTMLSLMKTAEAAEAARDIAIREMSAYARRCGELDSIRVAAEGLCRADTMRDRHNAEQHLANTLAAFERKRQTNQLVELPSRDALFHMLLELRRAKAKYPHFADDLDEGMDVLMREVHEVNDAIILRDIKGEHGVMREAAQVAAVALRIIELAMRMEVADADS